MSEVGKQATPRQVGAKSAYGEKLFAGAVLSKSYIRGVAVFVNKVRECHGNKDDEQEVILKELGKVRKAFQKQSAPSASGKGKSKAKPLTPYDRRKAIAKLLFMYLQGFPNEFGYEEAIALLRSPKYADKTIGYAALGVMLTEDSPRLAAVIPALKADLTGGSKMSGSLALNLVCNLCSRGMAEQLLPVIQHLCATSQSDVIAKRALMAVTTIFRRAPDLFSEGWYEILQRAMKSESMSEILAGLHLQYEMVQYALAHQAQDGAKLWKELRALQTDTVMMVHRQLINKRYTQDYVYYKVPSPFLQVKMLQFLQLFPAPPKDKEVAAKLDDIILRIMGSATAVRELSQTNKNTYYSCMFECVNLIIHMKDRVLLIKTSEILSYFLSDQQINSNHVYVGLDAVSRLSKISKEAAILLRQHQNVVINALQSKDISIRRRALNILYSMASRSNAQLIVKELLDYLKKLNTGEVTDFEIRSELVLKIAILAERFSVGDKSNLDYRWYVDVILQLIAHAGVGMADAVWYRAIKIITNEEDVQEYAMQTMFRVLSSPLSPNATAIKVGCYLLGEYGNLIEEAPASLPARQLEVVYRLLLEVQEPTSRSIILSLLIKFCNLYPSLLPKITPIFVQFSSSFDQELQQRSVEYLELSAIGQGDPEFLESICDVMPPYDNFQANEAGDSMSWSDSESEDYLGEDDALALPPPLSSHPGFVVSQQGLAPPEDEEYSDSDSAGPPPVFTPNGPLTDESTSESDDINLDREQALRAQQEEMARFEEQQRLDALRTQQEQQEAQRLDQEAAFRRQQEARILQEDRERQAREHEELARQQAAQARAKATTEEQQRRLRAIQKAEEEVRRQEALIAKAERKTERSKHREERLALQTQAFTADSEVKARAMNAALQLQQQQLALQSHKANEQAGVNQAAYQLQKREQELLAKQQQLEAAERRLREQAEEAATTMQQQQQEASAELQQQYLKQAQEAVTLKIREVESAQAEQLRQMQEAMAAKELELQQREAALQQQTQTLSLQAQQREQQLLASVQQQSRDAQLQIESRIAQEQRVLEEQKQLQSQQSLLLQQQYSAAQQLQKEEAERALALEKERQRFLTQQQAQATAHQQQQQQQLRAEAERQRLLDLERAKIDAQARERETAMALQADVLKKKMEEERRLREAAMSASLVAPAVAQQAPTLAAPPPQVPASAVVGLDETTRAQIKKLMIVDSGLLYQDQLLQIGVQSQFQQGKGRVQLFVGNKLLKPLSNFSLIVPPQPHLALTMTSVPPQVGAQFQAKVEISVSLKTAYHTPLPPLIVTYLIDGQARQHPLSLPLTVSKFCDPLALEAATWFNQWQALSGASEVQDLFRASHPINTQHISQLLEMGLRLSVLQGVDTNTNNIVGAGTLYTDSGIVGVLYRMETNPSAQMIRVTCKATSPGAAFAFQQLFIMRLSDPSYRTPNTAPTVPQNSPVNSNQSPAPQHYAAPLAQTNPYATQQPVHPSPQVHPTNPYGSATTPPPQPGVVGLSATNPFAALLQTNPGAPSPY
eukprot:TRINITY_DN1994_c0_g1_i1.p1 TRINITY_DN1994_c0_g1~~TRINITY_DN1994_c0_g1_i1.p1  ORF type:complete len:1540 (+),score=351.30 TRINITY_DN1994_c0_g1_i1:23-4621(+)